MINCNVCNQELTDKIYDSPASKSLTSLCKISAYPTEVFFCDACNHIQTREFDNELAYYDSSYNILTNSEDEDQIYSVNEDKTIFRTDHQLETLLSKIDFAEKLKLLDYGCGKSSTTSKLSKQKNNTVEIHLFDVSENYIPFWKQFLNESNWATYQTPKEWSGQFDLVTSFFSLEHISSLKKVVTHIKSLLKENGIFYGVVPNFLTNPADLIVVDHPNHFTKKSLAHLFNFAGFSEVEIDESSHRGAFVIKAFNNKLPNSNQIPHFENIRDEVTKVSNFWSGISQRVTDFESNHNDADIAIYGAGFYGAFIYRNLRSKNNVKAFLDQNPYLKNTTLFDIPVISPDKLPKNVKSVYVGLNPLNAKKIIDAIPHFNSRYIDFFYL